MSYQPFVPGDIPSSQHEQFSSNYLRITKGTDKLFAFVADHKFEHLNSDFQELPEHIQSPEHLFRIAQFPEIGAFITHPGLIARYAYEFPDLPYIMKLNGKTNLNTESDPMSALLWSVDQAFSIAERTQISLCGVALTVYIGSQYEDRMLMQAAQVVYQAHQEGLVVLLFVYPRGKAVKSPEDFPLLAGATGLAHSLGADFVKIHAPPATKTSAAQLQPAAAAAGNTGVICAGGKRFEAPQLLESLYYQTKTGHMRGCAIGRNLFQLSLTKAHALAKSIASIVYDRTTLQEAKKLLR